MRQNGAGRTMIIQISLAAGRRSGAASDVAVETAMHVDVADPRWGASLVDSVTRHAHEGARRLVAELTPAVAAAEPTFVPLADLAPRVSAAGSQ